MRVGMLAPAVLSVVLATGTAADDPPVRPVYYVLDQRIWRVGADGTGAKALALTYGTAGTLAVSPAGDRLAFVDMSKDTGAICVATDEAVVRRVALPPGFGRVFHLRWSPKGDRLVLEGDGGGSVGAGHVRVLDVESGTLAPIGPEGSKDMDPTWSPDGRSLAVVAVTRRWEERPLSDVFEQFWDGAVEVVDLRTGVRRRIAPPSRRLHSPAWSPDGSLVAYASITDVYVVPAAGGEPRSILKGNPGEGPMWTPDGKRILVTFPRPLGLDDPASVGATVAEVVTLDPRGGERRSFSVEELWDLSFGPGGAQLALVLEADRVVRVAADGTGSVTLAKRPATSTDRIPILTEVSWTSRP